MKVKVKGLVFVGFAAAVFAQSAMADITPVAADRKVVASKYYVDDIFQPNADRVEATPAANSDDWNSTEKYPSMAVLKDVVDDVAGIHGDTNYIEVTEDANGKKVGIITNNLGTTGDITAGTNTGRLATVGAVNGLLDTGISGTETDNTVPTSLAVQTYAEATANKLAYDATNTTETITAAATATTNNTSNVTFPTTKNVYEFVKAEGGNYQRKLTSSEDALYIGKWDGTLNNNQGDSTWKALEAVATGDQATTDYVTIKENNGVYQVNIPTAQIATTAALTGATATNDTGLVTAGSIRETILQAGSTAGGTIDATTGAVDTTVPTTKNVYEFVTNYAEDNYQPRVADTDTGKVMIGYNTATTNGGVTTYSSNWKQLTGISYVNVYVDDAGNPKVGLNQGYIADSATVITNADGTGTNSEYNTDLTTAAAVHAYVQGLLHGNEIPAMPEGCTTAANNGGYCALVYGDKGDNTVGLQWTVMAPAPSNPSNP